MFATQWSNSNLTNTCDEIQHFWTNLLVVDGHVAAVESLIRERLGRARDGNPGLVPLGGQGAELALGHSVALPLVLETQFNRKISA